MSDGAKISQKASEGRCDVTMLDWLTVIVGVVGIAIILAIPAWMWYMVIYGLVQIAREKRGVGGLGQSRWSGPELPSRLDLVEDSSLPRTEPVVLEQTRDPLLTRR